MSWVRAKVSIANFAERAPMPKGIENPRKRSLDVKDRDLEIEKGQAGLPKSQQL